MVGPRLRKQPAKLHKSRRLGRRLGKNVPKAGKYVQKGRIGKMSQDDESGRGGAIKSRSVL